MKKQMLFILWTMQKATVLIMPVALTDNAFLLDWQFIDTSVCLAEKR